MLQYLKEGPRPSREAPEEVKRIVSEMLLRIEREGEPAVREYSRQLDNWDPPSFRIGEEEFRAAERETPEELRAHIDFAQEQVRRFAELQRGTLSNLEEETLPGVLLGHRHIPISAVGSYVPGGRYPMLASAFMTVLVAKVAGVERVVAAAPPQGGAGMHAGMLYAIVTSGADEVISLGGVQALAAMAFGLPELEPVDMICGAGNAYVAEAKRQLYGRVGIDLLAGPTEVLVIGDETADAELIAADLLGQTEHGPTSPAVMISTSLALAREVEQHVERLAQTWPTGPVAGEAWRDYGTIAIVESDEEAIALSDAYAPEHLEVQVAEDRLDFTSSGCATTARSSSARRRRWHTATRRWAQTTCFPRGRRRATQEVSG
jgi:sulfopropanediol 3-dehydrogenase